jgi:glycosyltransferase involved in cell wall biosynthesis
MDAVSRPAMSSDDAEVPDAERGSLAVIDSVFPQKNPLGFRNMEISEYLRRIPDCVCFGMESTHPPPGAWFSHPYGVSTAQFDENLAGYLAHYPQHQGRVRLLDPRRPLRFKLAYTFFLAETYVLLPVLEKWSQPFVFVLYPGGAFGLNHEGSDRMLRRIFGSACFRKVIVTQRITRDYLINTGLCAPEAVEFIFGGVVQFRAEDLVPKVGYREGKDTFDICFVAARYTPGGIDKGFDLFLQSAKALRRMCPDVRFHVVGPWGADDADCGDLLDRIEFYGWRPGGFFPAFYSRMDVLLSPNRPNILYPGNFDGFPLGVEAQCAGVALFLTDELGMNTEYREDELVIVRPEVNDIVDKIRFHRERPELLRALSAKGQARAVELFRFERQIDARLRLFCEVEPSLGSSMARAT